MTNLKYKSLLGALALASSLLITTAAMAQTATPPPTPSQPVQPTPLATRVPAQSMEDDRRILRGDRTISGDNFVLRSNETLRGDLTIFGGNATLEEGSMVEGNINMFGGNADIAGTVTGNISLVGGNALLRSSAVVEGDINKMGGSVNRAPGAQVQGSESSMNVPAIPGILTSDTIPNTRAVVRDRGPFDWFFSVITSTITTILGAILISLLALAIVALLPNNVTQAAAVLSANWLMSGAVGALTLIAVPILAVVLAVTICLIPISLLLILALVVAIIAGWTISARILGERVMHALHRNDWALIGQTVAGAVLLALLGAVPIIGGLIGFVATALGLGALVLTRAGTRPYPMPVTALVPIAPISPGTPMDIQPVPRTEPVPPTTPSTPPPTAPASDVPATTQSSDWWKTSDVPPTAEPPVTGAPSSDVPPSDNPPQDTPPQDTPPQDTPPANPT
jgi:hypothetical protein